MTKEELTKYCRYYKGEETSPFEDGDIKNNLWYYEQAWIEFETNNNPILKNMIQDYINAGLADFESSDGTPIGLKAVLFNRFEHWNQAPGFEDWYRRVYVGH